MAATQAHGNRLIKNSFFSLVNTGFSFITSWIISIWVARQLGPSNYGIFSMVLWCTGTVTCVIGMGFTHAITKFVAEHHGSNQHNVISSIIFFVLKIEVVLSVGVTAICLFFVTPIADYFFTPKESFYFFLAFLGLVPGIVTAIISAAVQGIQKFEYFTIANLVVSPLSFAAKLCVLIFGFGIEGLLVVMLVFSFVNVLFYIWVLRKEGIIGATSLPLTTEIKQRIKKYNWSVSAILLCDKIIWDKSENFFLGRLCTASQIGFYNLGFNIVQKLASILPTTFWNVLFPAMSNYFGSDDKNRMKRLFFVSTRYLAFFTFPLCLSGMLLAFPLLKFLYGPEYLDAQHVVQLLFFASIFSCLANPASAILFGFEKQSFIYKFGAILAVVNIVLDILLIKKYGAFGAAVAYTVTTICASVGGLIYTCSTMKLKYPLVSISKIIFSTSIMGIIMWIVIQKNNELPGALIALGLGTTIYLICSLILGTFEKEDYSIIASFKNVLPGKTKVIIDVILRLIVEFKNEKPA